MVKNIINVDGETYKKVPSKGYTLVSVILDMSGSMGTSWEATISAFNEYIGGLKADKKNEYKVSLTLFDEIVEQPYSALEISEVPELTKKVYRPRGMTALYDAVCTTLNRLKDEVSNKDKSLVVIITDGEENSSKEFTSKQMTKLKKDLENEGNWSFIYLGANQDAWLEAQRWGFNKGNVSTFNNTVAGNRMVAQNLRGTTQSFAASSTMSLDSAFTPQEQQQMEETK